MEGDQSQPLFGRGFHPLLPACRDGRQWVYGQDGPSPPRLPILPLLSLVTAAALVRQSLQQPTTWATARPVSLREGHHRDWRLMRGQVSEGRGAVRTPPLVCCVGVGAR